MNPIPHYSWSFSSLQLFECPKKYELLRAKKIVSVPPSGAAADEGTRIHTMIEKWLMEDVYDPELDRWKNLMTIVKAKNGQCEVGYHFKFVDYSPGEHGVLPRISRVKNGRIQILVRCEADDPEAWFRSYIDWIGIDGDSAEIIDWKTGKVKLTKQMQFYAWVVMLAHPEVKNVKCTFHFINHRDKIDNWYTREQFESGILFEPFREILEQIDNCYMSDVWFEIPGEINKYTGRGVHCTYCPVTNEHCSNGKDEF